MNKLLSKDVGVLGSVISKMNDTELVQFAVIIYPQIDFQSGNVHESVSGCESNSYSKFRINNYLAHLNDVVQALAEIRASYDYGWRC